MKCHLCNSSLLLWVMLLILINSCLSFRLSNSNKSNLKHEIFTLIERNATFVPSKKHALLISVIQNGNSQIFQYPDMINLDNQEIHNTAQYPIGGLSKVFIGSLLKQLMTKGLIDLNNEFNSFLPNKFKNDRLKYLTLLDLVNHQSGFPKIIIDMGLKDDGNPYHNYSKLDLLNYYKNYTFQSDIQFNYSHINYALLEIALEHKFNTTMNKLFTKYLFSPLNMNNSVIYDSESMILKLTPGFRRNGEKAINKSFKSFGASLGGISNMDDLNKYIQRILITNEYSIEDKKYRTATHSKRINMQGGWYDLFENDMHYLMHAGRSNGHYAFVSFVKSKKTAVIILSNSAKGIDYMGIDIIRKLCQ